MKTRRCGYILKGLSSLVCRCGICCNPLLSPPYPPLHDLFPPPCQPYFSAPSRASSCVIAYIHTSISLHLPILPLFLPASPSIPSHCLLPQLPPLLFPCTPISYPSVFISAFIYFPWHCLPPLPPPSQYLFTPLSFLIFRVPPPFSNPLRPSPPRDLLYPPPYY